MEITPILIRFGYEIAVTCTRSTPMVSLLSVRPEDADKLHVPERVVTEPDVPTTTYRDLYGNICRRFIAPQGDFSIRCEGVFADDGRIDPADFAATEVPVAQLPDEHLIYLMGSRYCETDRLSQFAWDTFGQVSPGWNRVQAICDFVHGHIDFDYMAARATRTAYEAWEEGTGVCRDYAHLAVALCRCMNIPARYVNGYLGDIGVPIEDPMDFSAWMEVYLGSSGEFSQRRHGLPSGCHEPGEWWTFDPRNNRPRIGRILIARGRDAADVPLINSFGPHLLKRFSVWTAEVT